jgi:hypothetical protein
MMFDEESSRPEDRRCLRFKCSSFYELNAVNTLPVHDLSAVNDYILRFKYSSTSVAGLPNVSGLFLTVGGDTWRRELLIRDRVATGQFILASDSKLWGRDAFRSPSHTRAQAARAAEDNGLNRDFCSFAGEENFNFTWRRNFRSEFHFVCVHQVLEYPSHNPPYA